MKEAATLAATDTVIIDTIEIAHPDIDSIYLANDRTELVAATGPGDGVLSLPGIGGNYASVLPADITLPTDYLDARIIFGEDYRSNPNFDGNVIPLALHRIVSGLPIYQAWYLQVKSDGKMFFIAWDSSNVQSNFSSGVTIPTDADGMRAVFRGTDDLDPSKASVQFFYSRDSGTTWVELVNRVYAPTAATITSLKQTTGPITIGERLDDTPNPFHGTIKFVELYGAADETDLRLRVDFRDKAHNSGSFTNDEGVAVTVQTTGNYATMENPTLGLNPYLLFDAELSMGGTLEAATLDLNPSVPSSLDVITAARTGVASYVDSSGFIQSAVANTVRVDNSLGYPAILIEPSATNLLHYSEDFNNSWWSKSASGTGVTPVVTPNYAFSPDGTQNASKIVFNSGSGTSSSDWSLLTTSSSTTSINALYTHSIYLKGAVGGEKIFLRGVAGSNYTEITLTTDWVRYETTETAQTASSLMSMGIIQGLGSFINNSSVTIYAFAAQLETGNVVTSYIPTSGSAVTRAEDNLSITGSAFSDFFNGSEGTFYVEGVDRQSTGSSHPYIVGQSTSQFFMYKNAGSTSVVNLDGTNQAQVGSISENQLFRAAVSYKTSGSVKSISFNGTSEVDQPYSGNFAATNILKIGHGYTDVFSGHFRRILFWPNHSDSLSSPTASVDLPSNIVRTNSVTYEPVGFKFKLPSITGNGVQDLSLEFSNVDRRVNDFIDTVEASLDPVTVTHRVYLSGGDFNSVPESDPPLQLTLSDIEISAFTVRARASFVNIVNKQYPTDYYDRDRFPSI